MKQDDKIKRIKELKELIEKYNYHYYVLNESLVSDYEYDLLLKELEKLENELNIEDKESPTQKVGSDLSNKFAPVEHKYPMLSLQNTYGYDEILDFDVKVKKGLGLQNNEDVEYVCENDIYHCWANLISKEEIELFTIKFPTCLVSRDNSYVYKNSNEKIIEKYQKNICISGNFKDICSQPFIQDYSFLIKAETEEELKEIVAFIIE